MENLLLSPDEQRVVVKYKIFLERKYNVSICLPENLSSCSRDIVVATVTGENINPVKTFIQSRMAEMKLKQEQRIVVENNVTTITLSDGDSDSSLPVLTETKQKRKRRRRRGKPRPKKKELKEMVDLSSTILIEDSDESVHENLVLKRPKIEKENTMKFNEIEGETSLPAKVNVELPTASANLTPTNNAQIIENTSEDNVADDTIILSDSPPPDFISLCSAKEKENIPNRIDDSDIIIEAEIPRPIVTKPRCLRPIVIDGSNVAREHGKVTNTFSCKGIQIAINYFLQKGHQQVTAFVPHYRRHNKFGPILTTDQPLLEELNKEQRVVFTPSRRIDNKRVTCYDDRFIVELATTTGGVILSNDNYRDIAAENEEFKKTINERLLMFCFVGDIIMIPQDPLGRHGPSLENFLSFPN